MIAGTSGSGHELYVNRSYELGFDINDWLLAETDIDGKNQS